jgi:hypothetical protein
MIKARGVPLSAAELQAYLDNLTKPNLTADERQAFIKTAVLQASLEAEPDAAQGRCWVVRYIGASGPEIALYVPRTGGWFDENLEPVSPPSEVRSAGERAAARNGD